jgi:hypothetical protein
VTRKPLTGNPVTGDPVTGKRGVGRKVAAGLLWTVTALLVLLGVLIAAGGAAMAGLVFVFLLAAFTGSAALAVTRTGHHERAAGLPGRQRRARRYAALPRFAEPAARVDVPSLLATLPAADSQTRYTERHSQFPVVGGPIGLLLLAGSIAAAVGVGTSVQGIAIPVATFSGLFSLFVLLDLPNGIEISDGRFTVGVLAVPPRTRLWRRISGPLDAVREWDVLTPAQVRQLNRQRPAKRRSGGQLQYLGDLRMLGRRGVLRLVTDPESVHARFPENVLRGYLLLPTGLAGGVWDGVILICTRRPAALAAALERALPGRRGASEYRSYGIRS